MNPPNKNVPPGLIQNIKVNSPIGIPSGIPTAMPPGMHPQNIIPQTITVHPGHSGIPTSGNNLSNPGINITVAPGQIGIPTPNNPTGMQGINLINYGLSMNQPPPGSHPSQPINISGSSSPAPMNRIMIPTTAMRMTGNAPPGNIASSGVPGSPHSIPVQSNPQVVQKPITPQIHTNTPLPTDKHVISREKLQELVQMFDSTERLDPEAEDLLLLVADEFVDSVTEFACKLAKHRKSNTLEARDLELHLEKAWNIKIPGYNTSTPTSADSTPLRRPNSMTTSHQQRLMDIKKTKK